MGRFTLRPVAHVTVDFKNIVGDLSYAGSTLVEKECLRGKQGYNNCLKHNNSLRKFLYNTEILSNASA